MRAVLYGRVSDDDNGTSRSVDDQITEGQAFCDRQGWTVVKTFRDDGIGASRFSRGTRTGWADLCAFLTGGHADALVVWEASRTSRDLSTFVPMRDLCRDAGVLLAYSGRIYDLSRSDDSFTVSLDAVLAERESAVSRDRTIRGMRSRAATGLPNGKRAYGYRYVYDGAPPRLVAVAEEPAEAAIVREVAERVRSGQTPYAVARDLNDRLVPSPGNGSRPWDQISIRRMLTNPTYLAQRTYRGRVIGPAAWPPLLDAADFAALAAKYAANPTGRDSAVTHLLSGIARCGRPDCPGVMRLATSARQKPHYKCSTCQRTARDQQRLEDYVTEVTLAFLQREDLAEVLLPPTDDDAEASARARLAELAARLAELEETAAAGAISPGMAGRLEAKLLAEIHETETALGRADAAIPPVIAQAAGPDAGKVWAAMPTSARREVIRFLMEVTVPPMGRGSRGGPPCQITWKHAR